MDDDGVELGKRVPIKVKVIVEGRRADDRSQRRVSPQVRGFYNSGDTTGDRLRAGRV